jgi:hypothetical protein
VFVPSKKVVKLMFLLISHLNYGVIEFGEHEKISEGQMICNEERSAL